MGIKAESHFGRRADENASADRVVALGKPAVGGLILMLSIGVTAGWTPANANDWRFGEMHPGIAGLTAPLVAPDLYTALSVRGPGWDAMDTPAARITSRPRVPAELSGPEARTNWFYIQRAYPLDTIPAGARLKSLEQTAKIEEVQGRAKASSGSLWTLVGPVGFNSNVAPGWGQMSGRVRALAIDPTNSSRLLLGTATGGAWLSTDAGASWTPLTDDQPSLAVGAVAIDPNDPNVFYVGTGEGNGSYYGVGILKSVDAGASWQVIGGDQFASGQIVDILVSPDDSNLVVVCAKDGKTLEGTQTNNAVGGIYRSTDGGQSFQLTANNYCRGLRAAPNNFNVMFHSALGVQENNGLYGSTDAGASWNLISGAVNGADIGRLAIGISNDGSRIAIGGKKGSDVVLQFSADGGQTWSDPGLTPIPDPMAREPGNPLSYCESQCNYDNVIAINPFDPEDIILGGVGLYRTQDGGGNFARVGENNNGPNNNQGQIHVDHHVIVHDRTAQGVVYGGNDGGVYRSTDGGTTWASIGGTLATLQPNHVSLHPTDRNIFFAGNQDNGTTRRTGSNIWTEVEGGDGSDSAIDFNDPRNVYISFDSGVIAKSTDGGNSFGTDDIFKPMMDEPVSFVAPLVMDPSNSAVLYVGTNRLNRTTDGGANWAPVSPVLTRSNDGSLTEIAIAPSNSEMIYTTASDGAVARGVNGNFSVINSSTLPNRFASSVVVHPTDPNTAYVSYSGFNSATPQTPGHVFKTTDAGGSWTDVSVNLPDAPINTLAIRPDQPEEIYAGGDTGVFISTDGGGSWARMNNGLPNAGVSFLAVNANTNLLAAATYGRSVWVTDLNGGGGGGGGGDDHGNSCAEASAAPTNGTVSGTLEPNDDVDFFRLTLSGNATLVAEADSQFDSFGTLYDANCTQIAQDDDGAGDADNRNFRIQQLLNAGTYFLRVSSFNGASGGAYQVGFGTSGGGGGSGGAVDQPVVMGQPLPAPNPPNANCPSGYFTATIDDGPGDGVSNGLWGLELALDAPGTRDLQGGLNFGGLVDVGQAGFAGANITNPAQENQRLNLSLTGSPSSDSNGSLPVRITIARETQSGRMTVYQSAANLTLARAFEDSVVVEPGYYVSTVEVDGFPASAAGGAPEGQFFFSLTTSFVDRAGGGFQGGVVVGGYHAINPAGGVSGFAGFCISTPHSTSIQVSSAPRYGPSGARDLRLRLLDQNGATVVSVPQ